MRLLHFLRVVALIVVPVGSFGQQNLGTAHRAIAESFATPSGGKITCADVSAWINGALRAHSVTEEIDSRALPQEISLGNLRSRDLDCGAVPTLDPGIRLELMKIFFDRTLHSWEFLVRCAHLSDCVPFLVRWPQPAAHDPFNRDQATLPQVSSSASRVNPRTKQHFLLRPGETVTLVWDQDGIRVVLPAICLEQGNVGESIRVRTKNGGRVLRAKIVNASLLQVVL